jgi:hypothetical protein
LIKGVGSNVTSFISFANNCKVVVTDNIADNVTVTVSEVGSTGTTLVKANNIGI